MCSLSDALNKYSGNQCADLHDKAYGLLGITYVGEELEVDYPRNKAQVFDSMAQLLMSWVVDGSEHQGAELLRDGYDVDSFAFRSVMLPEQTLAILQKLSRETGVAYGGELEV